MLQLPSAKLFGSEGVEVLHRVEIETATAVLREPSRAAYERVKAWR